MSSPKSFCTVFTAFAVAGSCAVAACGSDLSDPGLPESGQGETVAPKSFVDSAGRTWVRSAAPVAYQEESARSDLSARPSTEIQRSPIDFRAMPIEEAAAALRPKTLRGDWEYTLTDEDALEFARAVLQPRPDVDEEGTPGEPALGAEGEEAKPLPENRAIIGSDDRYSIDAIKHVYPFNNIAAMSDAGSCTAFKLVNHHTAVTAAHCVHNGSGWLPRKKITFGGRTTVGSTCYGMSVPSCWDGDEGNASCDYATIKFREGWGYCNLDSYNVGYMGTAPLTSVNNTPAYVAGYPGEGLKSGWTYPELVMHGSSAKAGMNVFVLYHYMDTTGGQSGAPVFSPDYRVYGVHHGMHNGINWAAKIYPFTYNWLSQNSGW